MASSLWQLLLLTMLLTGPTCVVAYNSSADSSSSIVVGNITWVVGSCSYKAIDCHPEADCEENIDNTTDLKIFRCFCPPGLSGDGYTNGTGCATEYTRCIFKQDCHQFATCNGTSYCECDKGFVGDGFRWCNDTDECLLSPCHAHADCLNNPGNFTCVCHFQDKYYGNGFQCEHQCSSNFDCHPHAICNDTRCLCTPGFNGTGLDCNDVDECTLSPCLGAGTFCVNTPGSYRCDCENGYIKTKDGVNCEKAPKDCEEIRIRWPGSSDGMYTIDPDFTGPAKSITVYCDMRGDYAVTEVVVSATPLNASGAQVIDYKADDITLQALIGVSVFCQQSVSLSCSASFLFDSNFYWKDSFGNNHTSWSGASEEGKCSCGEVRACGKCYCGNQKKTSDAGTFVDKQKLPVTFINWRTNSESTFVIGNFRCAPRIFDIAQDCSNLPRSGPTYISFNGALARPVLVMCDVTSYKHVTVIEMQTKISLIQPLDKSEVAVDYVQGLENVEKIINGSFFCVQSVNYRCKNSPINSNQTYVRVTSQRRQLTYFPGANGVANSCACGATTTCDDTSLSCNCDAGGPIWRQDFGDIINKEDLPVVGVVANVEVGREGEFTISTIRCAAKQFGIQPNCEKLRKSPGFVPITNTYFIDPDGPGLEIGNVLPLLVYCIFQAIPAQGITVIHHGNENAFEVSGNVSITYLQASILQLAKLKLRSTYCSQEIEVVCSRFSLTWNSSAAFWSTADGNKFRLDQTLTTCAGVGCKCDGNTINGKDSGLLTDLNTLPVTFIDFSDLLPQLNTNTSAQVKIGPLKCFETFPTCNEINSFIKSGKGVEGEPTPVAGFYTIDVDGPGDLAPFEVYCSPPNTKVDTDTDTGSIVPNGTQPASWAGSSGEDSCACGVGGYCDGNRTNKCNCDMEDGQLRTDGGILIKSNQLPVCQVCLSVDGIPGNPSPVVPLRRLQFQLSGLVCHPGSAKGIQKSCQDVRAQAGVLTADKLQIVYMVPSQPMPVACRLLVNPAIGQLEIFPTENTYVIPPTQNVSLVITYYSINITYIYQLMQTHVYCSQRIYMFCLSEGVNITLGGQFGWTSIQGDLQYSWQQLRAEEIPDSLCSQHPDQCLQCGKPVGFAVHEKRKLPITGLTLPQIGSVIIVVDDIRCTDVFETCYQIMASGDQSPVYPTTNEYVIDPDGAGGVEPFHSKCGFMKTQNCATTEVPVQDALLSGVRVQNVLQPGGQSTPLTYKYATEEQIKKLINVSPYVWQPVQFECLDTKLINSASPAHSYYTLQHQPSFSFGTDNDTDVIGCPCSLTGTCEDGVTCHCDKASGNVSRDWGIVSRKDKLPITSVAIGGQNTSRAYGVMTVGSVFCSNCINRYPRDCQEAIEWGERYGTNYRRSGEFYINPSPGVIPAFPVFCEMNVTSSVGITRIHSSTLPRTPLAVNSSSSHGYFASMQAYRALIQVSAFCVQPVKYECYKAKLLGGGAFWSSSNNVPRYVWGTNVTGSCACGVQSLCGGLDSKSNQRSRKCNCDVFDEKWRVDAGLLTDKSILPVTSLNLVQLVNNGSSYVMVTIGDLYCSQSPIAFNECAMGFHECHEQAVCNKIAGGYTCTCKKGWEGKNKLTNSTTPVANGRECMDDDECSFGPCPYNTDCFNLPGTFNCTCKPGWNQTGPTTCVDINECKAGGIANCDINAYCINLQGSFRCVCKRSFRGSGNKGDCHEVGVCKIFGDPHTLSFDGNFNNYQGNKSCGYIACQDGCNGGDRSFRVVIVPWQQNPPLPGVGVYTWIKEVKVDIPGHEIMLRQGRVMTVDGIAVHGFTAPGYLLLDNGRQAILQTSWGLELYWDGQEELDIVLSTAFMNTLCGLCGNFNFKPEDDWTVGPGCKELQGNVTNNYQIFGNSWVDLDSYSNNSQCTPDCKSPPPPEVCYSPVQVVNDYCDRLFNESRSPFSACLKLMDSKLLAGLRYSCHYDLCRIKTDIMKTLCNAAQSLAQDCQLNYLFPLTQWRTSTFCEPKCSNNMTYMLCGPDPNNPTQPERTCLHVRQPDLGLPDKVVGCLEGCYCPIGLVKEGNKCLRPEACGCYDKGLYIPLGETNTAVGCVQTMRCKAGGELEEIPLQCGPNSSCRLENEVVGCHCNPGFMGDGVTCVTDPCYNVTCPGEGMECVKGVCECSMGFIGDCKQCIDINECASQTDDCDREMENCFNFPGGYTCLCKDGYIRVGDTCTDVDECKHGLAICPSNSICVNKPGKYSCACCIGYSMSSDALCVVNNEEMSLYRGNSNECCTCSTPACGTPGRVCGSDGRTYDSLRALVVQSCLNETRVDPLYAGACKDTCDGVQCSLPFSECRATKGKAECVCPKCIVDDNIPVWLAVCGSDKRVYRTVCELQAKACSSNNKQLIVMSSMAYCTGTELGPCDMYTCAGPGEICVELKTGPHCQCPSCEDETRQPVCGALLNKVDTYDTECQLRVQACLTRHNYYILDNVSCEAAPITCNVTQNFVTQEDDEGCRNPVPFDLGKCGGGCGRLPDKCCYKSRMVSSVITLDCPDGRKKEKEVEVIKECACIPPEEVARREGL
ncbi:hypothetical protein C0Q70_03095 [Pomacea canaliculata]|uniref:Uncharacterized protein n=1 Tax=Pomacea canaliculata TaxID=400727 RepID=A0A2T7PRS0_POMCA|nr:hypothetical protein C0Q70_03095 [Pomacea canaliculata]